MQGYKLTAAVVANASESQLFATDLKSSSKTWLPYNLCDTSISVVFNNTQYFIHLFDHISYTLMYLFVAHQCH